MDPGTVMFAIEAGVRLGKKFNDVLISETIERPLLLPVGNLFAEIGRTDALAYFARHRNLSKPGGPYRGFSDAEKVHAYKTILIIGQRVGDTGDVLGDAVEIVTGLARFEQFKKGLGDKPALQRILGTVVEIGIDYFAQNLAALGADSPQRTILLAIVQHLDDVDFAEGESEDIARDVLLAGLRTLDQHTSLLDDDMRLHALLGGVTKTLMEEVEHSPTNAERLRRKDFMHRIASSVLRGGAGAFTENIDLFLHNDSAAKAIVGATLSQLIEGIRGKEDLFTNESIELLFQSALKAVAANTTLLSRQGALQDLVRNTIVVVTGTQGRKLFSDEAAAAVLFAALDIAVDHMEVLVQPNSTGQTLVSGTLRAMANGLASSLAGGGTAKDLLSKKQLAKLSKIVLREVARHPHQLLGGEPDNDRKIALTQIISSVAQALGDDPRRFLSGEGLLELIQETIHVAVNNVDGLLDLDTTNPKRNLLFQVINEIVDAIVTDGDPRRLVGEATFVHLIRELLPVLSANIEGLVSTRNKPVRAAVGKALELASGSLSGRINGANLAILTREILRQVLWNELRLEERTAVEHAARAILRAA